MTAVWTSDVDELTGRRGRTLTAGVVQGRSVTGGSGHGGDGVETGTGRWPARVRDLLHQVGDAAATPRGESPARTRR